MIPLTVPQEKYRRALRDIAVIEKYMKDELGLKLHPKKRYVQEVRKGVPFMGVVVYPKCTVPGRRFVRNFYDAAYRCAIGENNVESMVSYLGYAEQVNGKNLCKKVFDGLGWRYYF